MIDEWKKYGVIAGTNTRIGGYSEKEPFKSYNLGFDTGDPSVEKNIKKWLDDFNWNELYKKDRVFFARQVHTDNIIIVDDKALKFNNSKEAHYGIDGFITNKYGSKQVVISVITADCQPIFICDPKTKSIGILHAGWKGTKLKILERAINFMLEFYCSNTKDILINLGVCISMEKYEVSKDFKNHFNHNLIEKDGKYYFDISGENKRIAKEIGIPESNITQSDLCSYSEEELFYSHRRDKGNTGRMRSFISQI